MVLSFWAMFLSYLHEKYRGTLGLCLSDEFSVAALFKKSGMDSRRGGNLLERLISHNIHAFVIYFILRATDKFEMFTARVVMYSARIYL